MESPHHNSRRPTPVLKTLILGLILAGLIFSGNLYLLLLGYGLCYALIMRMLYQWVRRVIPPR